MLKKSLAVIILAVSCARCVAQPPVVNGAIVPSKSPVTILKIWGTHQERGHAYGYLLGEKISQTFSVYTKSISKREYRALRSIIGSNTCFTFDENILLEARAMVDGMNRAQANTYNLDYIDLLVMNSLFDLSGLKRLPRVASFACSSFMSWGDATRGTDLDGESVISRHFDWFNHDVILRNQVVIVHLPSEPREQPWASVGIAGQIGVTSAMSKSGVSAFLHAAPFTGLESEASAREPITLALRRGIETRDFNNDQQDDVMDVRAVLSSSRNGFARPCIVSALALAGGKTSQRVAVVAELLPRYPYLVARGNEYADNIPGDNLYTANSLLKAKNRDAHGTRNRDIISAIGDGEKIGSGENWALMRDHSRFKVPFNIEINMQFMQYIPGRNVLRLSVSTDRTPAFLHQPEDLDLNVLFSR